METTKVTRTAAIVAVVLLLAAFAAPVAAATSTTTQGSFAVFASGPELGYDSIVGTATMKRDKETEVEVEVESGLVAGLEYGSHVHDEPCDQNDANGHYFFDAPVPHGDGPNGDEIWPGPFTATSDGGGEGKTMVGAIAGPDAVSVVIHAPSGAKIACADLE